MSKSLTAWEKVQVARNPERPKALDYIENIFDDFIEFHGDRNFGDDKSIVGGIALFNNKPVTVVGEQKGKTKKSLKIFKNILNKNKIALIFRVSIS